jgi:glyoxylase-like metal-dependent hydrolase (beta-lactamase superfamily II)
MLCGIAASALMAGAAMAQTPASAPGPFKYPPAPWAKDVTAIPAREFEEVAPNVYRVHSERGNWWSLVVVTDEGILLGDPMSEAHGLWLKAEFEKRWPGKPVKYVVYSHSHWDHDEGGYAFPNAIFVAQENFLRQTDGRFPHFPGDMTDRNDSGYIDFEEINDPMLEQPLICGSGSFQQHDFNHDGKATGEEWYKLVPKPNVAFSERMTIMLGGTKIEIIFPGKNHANDGTVIYLPKEKVVFSSDFPADALVTNSMRSLPSSCGNFDHHPLSEWIRSYKTIEDLDFDKLVQGHGWGMFTKQDVTEGRQFFEYLRDQVDDQMRQGKGLAEIRRTVTLDKYKDWRYYERLRDLAVTSAYYNLKIYP